MALLGIAPSPLKSVLIISQVLLRVSVYYSNYTKRPIIHFVATVDDRLKLTNGVAISTYNLVGTLGLEPRLL